MFQKKMNGTYTYFSGVHLIPKPEVVGRDKQKIFKMENVDSYFEEVEAFLSSE